MSLLSTAIYAVQQAQIACINVQKTLISSVSKEDRSPVTIADFAAQSIVSMILQEYDAHIPLVGEEDAQLLRENKELKQKVCAIVQDVMPDKNVEEILSAIDRGTHEGGAAGTFWVLDPIDGTKGFLRKQQYAIALGLVENGEVTLGVLGCPNLPQDLNSPDQNIGSLFFATKNGGSFRWLSADKSTRISVSQEPFRFCESVEKGHSSHSRSQQIADRVGITAPPVRMDSQCKYALVAQGQAAAYLRLTKGGYVEKIWDHAAGSIIITEAGGMLTDLYGKPLDFSKGRTLSSNKGIIASSGGTLHQELIQAYAQTDS